MVIAIPRQYLAPGSEVKLIITFRVENGVGKMKYFRLENISL